MSAAARGAEAGGTPTPLERLGARIFFDASLSEPRGVPARPVTIPPGLFREPTGRPFPAWRRRAGRAFGTRKPPSLAYASFSPPFSFVDKKDEETGKRKLPVGGQFRDGRAVDLVAQAGGPLLNSAEMNNPSKAAVVQKIRDGAYADLFRAVFGEDVFDNPEAAFDRLTRAVAAFEQTAGVSSFQLDL